MCDYGYTQEIAVGDFKKKIKELELTISERTLHRLVQIFDEDFNGTVTLDEYFFALEVYNCRCEEYGPFDNDPKFVPYIHRSVNKFITSMKSRDMNEEELFRMIDVSNDGMIQVSEMEEVIKIFDDFKIKELHAIYNFFDIDGNGVIDA